MTPFDTRAEKQINKSAVKVASSTRSERKAKRQKELNAAHGLIFVRTRDSPAPGSARAGPALLNLHLRSGPDLNHQFDVIITPNASSACHDAHKSALPPKKKKKKNLKQSFIPAFRERIEKHRRLKRTLF